jgi:structural maintenance of chromosome 2
MLLHLITLPLLQNTLQGMRDEFESMTANVVAMEEDIVQKKKDIEQMASDREGQSGAALKSLEAATNEISKAIVKDTSAWQHKKEGYDEDKKAIDKLNKDLAKMTKNIQDKKAKVAKAAGIISTIQEEVTATQQKIADLDRQRQGLLAGCDAKSEEGGKTLADQLSDARSQAVTYETEMKQLLRRVKHFEGELKEKRKNAQSAGKEVETLDVERKKAQQKVDELEKELSGIQFDESSDKNVRAEIVKAQAVVDKLREEVDSLSGQVANYDVQFDQRQVDSAKVHGIVASLVKLKHESAALALEVACGARLYQMVVEDEATGKQMLNKGGLKKRVTIIPLNKIDQTTVSGDKIKAAKADVGDKASLALSMVDYDKDVEAAMKYVFGKTFVCQDVEVAKRCALGNPNIREKSVTLEGDLFDPAGTLTGGSRGPPGSSILLKFSALAAKRNELAKAEAELQVLVKQAQTLKQAGDLKRKTVGKLECAQHELSLTVSRLSANPYFKAAEELREMEETVATSEAELDRMKKGKAESEAAVKRIESDMKKLETSRDSVIAEKEKEIASLKKKLADLQGQSNASSYSLQTAFRLD